MNEFIQELIELCKKYDAVIFSRSDGKQHMLSIEAYGLWLDFKKIDKEGVKKLLRL